MALISSDSSSVVIDCPTRYQQPTLMQTPHNIQAEQALLGALLLENAVARRLPPTFDAATFFHPVHEQIFSAAMEMLRTCGTTDAIRIGELFADAEPVEPGLTIADYLLRLVTRVPTIIGAPSYAETVLDLARERWRRVGDQGWLNDVIRSPSTGVIRPLVANAMAALRSMSWRYVLAFDESTMATMLLSAPPFEIDNCFSVVRKWTTNDDIRTTEFLQRQGLHCGVDIVQQAVEAVARETIFHPVRSYLLQQRWDGRARVDKFATNYLGAPVSRYSDAVSRCTLLSAVARVMRPGCKVDTVTVIEGPQGIGKSSALEALAAPFFTDELGEMGSKDAALQTAGAWIIEISELDAMSRADVARVKAFISRTTDRFRPPYGRRVIEAPRQCIFIGTTNADSYLRDETGARRFWPIKAGRINLDAIRSDRDQIWAEALHRFERGERWWLAADEVQLAAVEQSARYVDDAWQTPIENFVRWKTEVSISSVLTEGLFLEVGRQSQTDQTRVARCLRLMGWTRHQKRLPDQSRTWVYRRNEVADRSDVTATRGDAPLSAGDR